MPEDYLLWLEKDSQEHAALYRGELDRRAFVAQEGSSLVERLVTEGWRSLSKKAHPDAGGSEEAMKQLNLAKEWLVAKIKEA